MGKGIVKCRVCKSRKLKFALTIHEKPYVICQTCTLLQQQEDVPYNIQFDFSSGGLSVDYLPYFLTVKQFPEKESVVYFTLKALEIVLQNNGYKVVAAFTTNEGRLDVAFEKMDNLDRIRLYEMVKKLDSQFTYFLHSVKNK